MSSPVPDYKRRALEQRRNALIEEYEAANGQLLSALSTVEQVRIQRRLNDLEHQIQEIDVQLGQDQIPEEAHESKEPGESSFKQRVPVRVFCILSQFCTNEMKELLLRQNQHQSFFDIGIANSWKYWPGRSQSEYTLQSLHTDSRLEFCEKFQEELNRYNLQQLDSFPPEGINLAITELPFPKAYFAWNTRDRKGIVIGIKALQSLFQSDPDMVRKIVVRVIQRMLLYSLQIPGLQIHEDTRGCLFDLARELTDIRFSVDAPRLCQSCEVSIRMNKGPQFYAAVNDWLRNSLPPVTT